MNNKHDILIVGQDEHRHRPYFVLRCTCGMYTTSSFTESVYYQVRDLADGHGLLHDEYTVSGPFSEFIINEHP